MKTATWNPPILNSPALLLLLVSLSCAEGESLGLRAKPLWGSHFGPITLYVFVLVSFFSSWYKLQSPGKREQHVDIFLHATGLCPCLWGNFLINDGCGKVHPCDSLHPWTSLGCIIMQTEQAKKNKPVSSFSPWSLSLFLLEILSSNFSVIVGTGSWKQVVLNQPFPLQEAFGHNAYHIHRKQRGQC